jgi:hypothetical protein
MSSTKIYNGNSRSVLCEEGTNFHNYGLADNLESLQFSTEKIYGKPLATK